MGYTAQFAGGGGVGETCDSGIFVYAHVAVLLQELACAFDSLFQGELGSFQTFFATAFQVAVTVNILYQILVCPERYAADFYARSIALGGSFFETVHFLVFTKSQFGCKGSQSVNLNAVSVGNLLCQVFA